MNKILPDLTYTKQAFEVDPHLRMRNTSKPGGLTPIPLAVWVCAADKERVSVSRCTPLPIVSQNIPPSLTNRKTDKALFSYIVDF